MNQTLMLLSQGFVQDALKAALLVAVTCSFLGVFVVLKRIVFVGAALAEVSSLGGALAFFGPVIWAMERLTTMVPILAPLDHYRPLLLGLALMLVAVAFFSREGLGRSIPREAIIGATYAGSIGLALLILSSNPSGKEHVEDALNGNILGVQGLEIAELAWVALIVGVLQGLFYKEFVLISFDPEVARTLGYRASRWELLWYLTLGVMIAVSIHVAGTILVFAYLVLPAITALRLSRRLGMVFLLSVLAGVAATISGILLSISADLPASPSIVGCSVALFCVASLGRAGWDAMGGKRREPIRAA